MLACKRPLHCAVVACVIAALYSIHAFYSRLSAAAQLSSAGKHAVAREAARPLAFADRTVHMAAGGEAEAPPAAVLMSSAHARERSVAADHLPAPVAGTEATGGAPTQAIAQRSPHVKAMDGDPSQRASWWNREFSDAMTSLLGEARAAGRRVTVASVGGSASAGKVTYLHQFADKLRDFLGHGTHDTPAMAADVHVFNPSAGQTGSVWGALHMEALIPKDTDIVIWEFTINDMNPESTGMIPVEWHKQAFELFLRRALALNPKMIIGIVSLWRPHARSCWPCEGDSLSFNHVIQVAACYNATGFFGVDGNALGQYLSMNKDEVFKDSHHPTPEMHKRIGHALFTHVRRSSSRRAPKKFDGIFSCEPVAGAEPKVSFDVVAFPRRTARNALFAALLDMGQPLQSLLYKKPVYGASMANIRQVSSQVPLSSGKSDSSREDRQHFVELPKCGDGSEPLRFRVGAHSRSLQFLGLNLRGWQGKMLGDPKEFELAERLLSVQVTSPVQQSLRVIGTDELRSASWHASVLTRGFAEPQAWFAPQSVVRGIEFPLEFEICQSIRAFGLGSFVVV